MVKNNLNIKKIINKKEFKNYFNTHSDTSIIGSINKKTTDSKKFSNKAIMKTNDGEVYYEIQEPKSDFVKGYADVGDGKFLEVISHKIIILWFLLFLLIIGGMFFAINNNKRDIDEDNIGTCNIGHITDIDDGTEEKPPTIEEQFGDYPNVFLDPIDKEITLNSRNDVLHLKNKIWNKDNFNMTYKVYIDGEPLIINGKEYVTDMIEPGKETQLNLWSLLQAGTYKVELKTTQYYIPEDNKLMDVSYTLNTTIKINK